MIKGIVPQHSIACFTLHKVNIRKGRNVMTRAEIFKSVIEMLEDERVVNKEALQSATEKTNIVAELGVHSSDIVNLVAKAEDRFKVEFEDDEVDDLDYTIESLIDLILKKLVN